MENLMTEMNAQMVDASMPVQIWMNWMMFIFASSIFFVFRHVEARFALLSFILTMPLAFAVFYYARTVHLLGIVHIIAWVPLAIYLVQKNEGGRKISKNLPISNLASSLDCDHCDFDRF